ncbi:long-chain-fatty-acid--CoA ligase [Psychrobacter lutiphocae]|uniref:long-chain-fatty-acid--CoA ligase n=1 Tax=Psychrobacter lutiphocae TaxID=540500 RepID=UPI00036D1524|nr:long-chain-fatty-acid--CoA ligase [Psychrobacter lutiphocae]
MTKFWTKNYPEGIASDIPQVDETLIDFFDATLKKFATKDLMTNMGVSYTYAQVDEISLKIASWIQSLGLTKGSSIALMMPNVNQYLPIIIGALRAGMVLTLINPLYTSRELKHQLVDSDAKIIFILEPFCHTLETIVAHTAIEKVIISPIGDMLGSVKGTLVNFAAKHIKKAVPAYRLSSNSNYEVYQFRSILSDAKTLSYSRPDVKADDLAMIQYTGGTTGVAKGILISHKNVVYGTMQYEEWFKPIYRSQNPNEQLTCVVALPLYHIFAFIISVLGMRMGQHLLVVTNPRDIDAFIKLLQKQPFHMLPAVNTLFHALLLHPKFKDIDFSQLKLSLAGGMAATPEMARKWQEITGVPIIEGWGMSETLGVGTANPLTSTEFTGTIGMPLPGVDIQILDEDENALEVGEVGEIGIKGGSVISGYHNLDNTQFFSKDGYLKTGDIGTMDENGYVKLLDRKKDMLIVSGFNVYPNEIEGVIEMYPKVRECSVVGVDSDSQGQSVKVFIVKDDPSLTKKEIHEFCKKNLAGYKRPRHIEFIDELPKSTVGKILRHKLRSLSNKK